MDLMLLILIVGGVIAIILLIIGVVVTSRSERKFVDERLGQYVDEDYVEGAQIEQAPNAPLTDWLNVQVEGTQWGSGISTSLAQADLKLKPAEYIALMVIAAVVLGAIAWFFGGKQLFSALIGVVLGLIIPRLYIGRLKTQRLNKFNDQLQDMLNLVVNGLRAGFSTVQALEAVSRELPPPISTEFKRVIREIQLGVSMETALSNLLRRIPSADLDFVIVAMNVQREVGGNLAEILDTISYTVRERVRIKGEIRVLTAQVIYSGRFIALLPIILSLVLWFINRDYIMSFFENIYCGIISLSCAGFLIGIGYFVMTRIADIEV